MTTVLLFAVWLIPLAFALFNWVDPFTACFMIVYVAASIVVVSLSRSRRQRAILVLAGGAFLTVVVTTLVIRGIHERSDELKTRSRLRARAVGFALSQQLQRGEPIRLSQLADDLHYGGTSSARPFWSADEEAVDLSGAWQRLGNLVIDVGISETTPSDDFVAVVVYQPDYADHYAVWYWGGHTLVFDDDKWIDDQNALRNQLGLDLLPDLDTMRKK